LKHHDIPVSNTPAILFNIKMFANLKGCVIKIILTFFLVLSCRPYLREYGIFYLRISRKFANLLYPTNAPLTVAFV